jgi:glycosyltransferase involved in cell wall biosynthesis
MDKISIITATYNCKDEIENTIKSLLEQDYPCIEYIVIDGASTDGTVDIIRKYADKIDHFVSEPDKGLYYAMNKGIELATGDWIYIYNSGGAFHDKDTLTRIFSQDLSRYDAIFGYIYSRKYNKYFKDFVPFYEQDVANKTPGYSHQALFVRSKWCKEYPFDTSYRCCADFNQAMTIHKLGAKFHYVDVPVAYSAPAGFSAKNRRIQLIENARINQISGAKLNMMLFKYDIKSAIKGVLNLLGGKYTD